MVRKEVSDVLGECDVTLAVRTQLIYPSRAQIPVDGNPHPWEKIEEILRVAESHLWNLQNVFPRILKLIVHRILLLTLKKRWNVQCGPHLKRDPMAAPVHAKGVRSDDRMRAC